MPVHPFVIILKPAVAMSAQPDPTVAIVAVLETLLFLAVGLWLAKYRRYEYQSHHNRWNSYSISGPQQWKTDQGKTLKSFETEST